MDRKSDANGRTILRGLLPSFCEAATFQGPGVKSLSSG
jgi:hypothetical protein